MLTQHSCRRVFSFFLSLIFLCGVAWAASVALSTSTNPAGHQQPLTITATITPSTATGTVSFYDNATLLGVRPIANGVATFTHSGLSLGGHSLTASYSGDFQISAATSERLIQNVLTGTMTALTSSQSSIILGQAVALTAAVAPASATGFVTFYDGVSFLGTTRLFGGRATFLKSNVGSRLHSARTIANRRSASAWKHALKRT